MPHFLEKTDRRGNGIGLWGLVAMAFLVPVCLWGLFSLRVEVDDRPWLSPDNPEYQALQWSRRHFPADEPLLFTWEGSSLDDPRVARLVRKIRGTADKTGKRRGGSKLIAGVQTPQELIAQMQSNEVSREDAISSLSGVLLGSGPVRVSLSEFGRARREKVAEALKRRALEMLSLSIEIAGPAASDGQSALLEALASAAEKDPAAGEGENETATGSENEQAETPPTEAASPELPPHDLTITWRGMHWDTAKVAAFKELALGLRLELSRSRSASPPVIEECFQVAGTPIALAIYLSEAGTADRDEALRSLFSAARDVGIDRDKMHVAGSAIAGAALRRDVLKAAWDPSVPLLAVHRRSIFLMSGLLAGILTLWLVKSFRLAGFVLGIACSAIAFSMASVAFTGGVVNSLLVLLPLLVLVAALSIAIPLANRWRQAAAADVNSAAVETMRAAFVPCLWAGAVIAIAYFSLATSSLTQLREFGLYCGTGALIAVAVVLLGLPALLALWPGRVPALDEAEQGPLLGSLGMWAARYWRPITAIGIIVLGGAAWGLGSLQLETGIAACFAAGSPTLKDREYIEDHLAGSVPVDLVLRFDRESQQQLKFLQRRNLVEKIEAGVKQLPDISGCVSLADFLPAVSAPAEHANVREKARFNAASRTVEARVKEGEPAEARSLLAVAEQAGEFNAEGDELWRVRARSGVRSQREYQELCARIDEIASSVLCGTSGEAPDKVPPAGQRNYHPGASHVVTGEIPLLLVSQREVLKSFIRSCLVALGGIALVLVLAVRQPFAGLVMILSSALPQAAVLGIAALCGVCLDRCSLLAPSVALGMAAQGALGVAAGFRSAIKAGKSRAQAAGDSLERCGGAFWQTSLISSAALVMLSYSELVPVSRFGWFLAALLAAGTLANLILMPALLAGPLGYLLERSVVRARDGVTTQTPAVSRLEPEKKPVATADSGDIPGKPHIGKKSVRIRRAD